MLKVWVSYPEVSIGHEVITSLGLNNKLDSEILYEKQVHTVYVVCTLAWKLKGALSNSFDVTY
jgi:hypothetical protein